MAWFSPILVAVFVLLVVSVVNLIRHSIEPPDSPGDFLDLDL